MKDTWLLNSAKTIGTSHKFDKNPVCQDDVLTMNKNGVNVICLSDGCGSSNVSEIGAKITVETICSLICENFDELYDSEYSLIRHIIIDKIRKEIDRFLDENKFFYDRFIKQNRYHYEDFKKANPGFQYLKYYKYTIFNATIQFVAVKDDKILAGRIGDGIIGAIRKNKLLIFSSEDKDPNVSENITWYPSVLMMTHDEYFWNEFQIIKIDSGSNFDAFFISSDGLDKVLINEENQYKYLNLEHSVEILNTKNLFDLLEHYKTIKIPKTRIDDDLSLCVMRKEDLQIDGLRYREYDENGQTLNNKRAVEVPVVNLKESNMVTIQPVKPKVVEEKINKNIDSHEPIIEEKINSEHHLSEDKKVIPVTTTMESTIDEHSHQFNGIKKEFVDLLGLECFRKVEFLIGKDDFDYLPRFLQYYVYVYKFLIESAKKEATLLRIEHNLAIDNLEWRLFLCRFKQVNNVLNMFEIGSDSIILKGN